MDGLKVPTTAPASPLIRMSLGDGGIYEFGCIRDGDALRVLLLRGPDGDVVLPKGNQLVLDWDGVSLSIARGMK